MRTVYNCGCGGEIRTKEEIEKIIREVKEKRWVPVRPVPAEPKPIPVENWPVRKEEPVLVPAER